MKKIPLIPLFLLFVSALLNAQPEADARKILDSFSSKALSAPSVSMTFKIVTVDQIENTNTSMDGSIVIVKDKYKLILPENTTWFNGSDSWNYMPDVNEVTITKPKTTDDSFISKPSSLFTLYKKGYKNRIISETANLVVVDMYPEDIKNDLVRIRLTISKPDFKLKNAEYKTRNGILITLNVNDYSLNSRYESTFFIFDPKVYKGIEIVDLR